MTFVIKKLKKIMRKSCSWLIIEVKIRYKKIWFFFIINIDSKSKINKF